MSPVERELMGLEGEAIDLRVTLEMLATGAEDEAASRAFNAASKLAGRLVNRLDQLNSMLSESIVD